MSRPKGTFMTFDSWAFALAPSLPGASGWVLLALNQQLNYRRQSLTLGQLLDMLPYKARALEIALAYLLREGYTTAHAGAHTLNGPRALLARHSRTNVRSETVSEARQDGKQHEAIPAIEGVKKKEEKKEKKKRTTPGTADAAPVEEVLPEVSTGPWDASTGTAVSGETEPPATVETAQPTEGKKVPRRAPADPTAFQLVFGQLAQACYGGEDGLTNEARARIGKAAKSLTAAGYRAADVPEIVGWIRANESWRTGTLAPQTVAERAPAWKAGARGNLPLTPQATREAAKADAARALEERYA